VIRRAVAADAACLAAMLRDLNSEPGHRPERITPESVTRDLISDSRALVLVAELDGAPAGLATAHPFYDTMESRWGLIVADLYVAPQARRRGLARALIAGLAAATRREGGELLWWDADLDDALALSFHRSLGAEEAPTIGFLVAGETFGRLADEAEAASPGDLAARARRSH
jgi:GNAT superfamily N-acetyltransferase